MGGADPRSSWLSLVNVNGFFTVAVMMRPGLLGSTPDSGSVVE